MSFLDFHVIVNKVPDDDRFVTVVAESPVPRWGYAFSRFGGSERVENVLASASGIEVMRAAQGAFHLRWNSDSLPGKRDLQLVGRRPGPALEQAEIGRALFGLLFPQGSAAYELLGRSAQTAQRENRGLLLKLELHSELANLPWEALRPPLSGGWAPELNGVPISILRYLGNLSEPESLVTHQARGRPCILVVTAHPHDLRGPYVGKIKNSFGAERQHVEVTLRRYEAQVECVVVDRSPTFFSLIEKVQQLQSDGRSIIGLHFIGHGGIDEHGGFLVGEDENAESQRIYEAELGNALDNVTSLRWVILNACSTAIEPIGCPLAGLATWMSVIKNVPTVIAYRRPVDTENAERLAIEFYKKVLERKMPIEDVIRSLQNQYSNPGGLVVLVRSVNGKIQSRLGFTGNPAQPRRRQRNSADIAAPPVRSKKGGRPADQLAEQAARQHE